MVRRTFWILPLSLAVVVLARGGYAGKGAEGGKPPMALRNSPPAEQAAPPPAAAPHRSREESALLAIQEEGRSRVRELANRIRNAATREERLELQKEVVAVKRETRLRLLQEHVNQAQDAGDQQRLQEARIQMERMTNPRRTEAPGVIHRDPPPDAGR